MKYCLYMSITKNSAKLMIYTIRALVYSFLFFFSLLHVTPPLNVNLSRSSRHLSNCG